MQPHRIAILSARRSGAEALYRLLSPALPGRLAGGQPFHWENIWGEVSRSFHQGAREQARAVLDARLDGGELFHHRYDAESWDFNEMLLDALGAAGYRLLVIERELTVDHLFSIVVCEHLRCQDAAAVERLREQLRAGPDVAPPDAQATRELVDRQWQTRQWFRRALSQCRADRLVCHYEDLFLRGVAGLAAVDEVFAFAGVGSRAAVIDDASLLRFIFSGHHYTAGLAAYSAALAQVRSDIDAELSRLQQEGIRADTRPDTSHGGR